MPWLLHICIFFSDFLIRVFYYLLSPAGVSNKHCLLSLFSFWLPSNRFLFFINAIFCVTILTELVKEVLQNVWSHAADFF